MIWVAPQAQGVYIALDPLGANQKENIKKWRLATSLT